MACSSNQCAANDRGGRLGAWVWLLVTIGVLIALPTCQDGTAEEQTVLGDFNRDGQLGQEDVEALLLYVAARSLYEERIGSISEERMIALGDFDGDGDFEEDDIERFLQAVHRAQAKTSDAPTPTANDAQPEATGETVSSRWPMPGSPPRDREFAFESGGQHYVLRGGEVFRVTSSGLKHVLQAYNFDFFEVNYVVRDGRVHLRDPSSQELYPVTRQFAEDFDDASSVDRLISVERWHSYNASPKKEGRTNYYEQGSRMSVEDGKLVCFAEARSETTKCSIKRTLMYFVEGDVLEFEFDVYIEPGGSFGSGFTIFDIESEWIHNAPGLRLIFRGPYLTYELKSFEKRDYRQQAAAFPTGRWVEVRGEVWVEPDVDGRVQLWQDGRKVIDTTGPTLPVPGAVYDKIELGITALGEESENDKLVRFDNFAVRAKAAGLEAPRGD